MTKIADPLQTWAQSEYKYGFVTDIERKPFRAD
jgi:hypothetical protein